MTSNIPNNQVAITYVRLFYRYLGSDPKLLEGLDTQPEELLRLGAYISHRDCCLFFRNAALLTQDASIGLELGAIKSMSTAHGIVGAAVYNSPTVYECLKMVCRTLPVRNKVAHAHWVERDDVVGFELEFKEDCYGAEQPMTELTLTTMINMVNVVAGQPTQPSEIHFRFPSPDYHARYFNAFHCKDIRFNQRRSGIYYAKSTTLQQAGNNPDPELQQAALERCEEHLLGIRQFNNWREEVEQLFRENPGHIWTLGEVANQLNMSPRTLQRHLRKEDNNYQKIQTEWLKQITCKLLLDPKLSIENIALMLGYADVRAFRHFCRREFQQTPSSLRDQLLSDWQVQFGQP